MDQTFIQIFLYLAGAFFVDGLLISLFRRLKLADFLAHITTGMILGFLLVHLEPVIGKESLNLFIKNKVVHYLAYLGLMLFMMQLGFNFDRSFLTIKNQKSLFLQAGFLILFSVLFLGSLGYFHLFEKNMARNYLFITAFLGVNIGAVLYRNFPVSGSLKKSFTKLLQIAILLDVLSIFLFSLFQLYAHYKSYNMSNILIEPLCGLILFVSILLSFMPDKIDRISRFLYTVTGEYALLLKLGIFFMFLYAGIKVGVSILLMGFWAGMLFRYLAGSTQFEAKQKFFPIASYLYILPFVEVGRFLSMEWQTPPIFWSTLSFLLLSLVGIALLFSIFQIINKENGLIFGLGVFPRGELTVLILWLIKETSSPAIGFPVTILLTGIVAVMVTSLLGTLLGKLLFLHPAETKSSLIS